MGRIRCEAQRANARADSWSVAVDGFIAATSAWEDAATRDWHAAATPLLLDSPVTPPPPSRALKQLGNYELLRRIGTGGMAQVWMGRRVTLEGANKAVAIKLVLGGLADARRYREMFVEETRLTMLLSHSNIVQVFDAGEADGRYFLVMEWIDGLNLAEVTRALWARGSSTSFEVGAFIVGEILRGLAYAHTLTHDGVSQCIVHRDVSPQNVLVSVSGEVKIVDFGVARLARDETSGFHVRGKLRYMAPEQLSGHSRHPCVDLYAVGAILHELLDGTKFRAASDETHLYAQAVSGEIPELAHANVPAELERLRRGLLEPDPSRRIGAAESALELLMRWPGYRNASLDLARVVRELVGVDAPRSGVHVAARSSSAGDAAVVRGEGDESSAGGATGATLTVSRPRSPGPPEGEPGTRIRVRSRPLVLATVVGSALAGIAVALATVDLGDPLAGLAGRPPLRETVAAAAADDAELALDDTVGSTDATARDSRPGVEVDSVVADIPTIDEGRERGEAGALPGPAGAPAIAAASPAIASEGSAAPRSRGNAERAAKPVEVRFKAGDFKFVYLRVGGREIVAEPIASLRLAPGSHRVFMREVPEEPWSRAGTLRVEAGVEHVVRMTRPHGMSVERLR